MSYLLLWVASTFKFSHMYPSYIYMAKLHGTSLCPSIPYIVGIMDWMLVFPPNSYVEGLSSNVMVFGGGIGGIWEVIMFRRGYEGPGDTAVNK